MTLTFRFLSTLTAPCVWTRFRQRRQARRSLGDLLAKHNDRLLDDVGLTRADAERLQRTPGIGR